MAYQGCSLMLPSGDFCSCHEASPSLDLLYCQHCRHYLHLHTRPGGTPPESHPDTHPRTQTVENLIDILVEHGVVLVRGTRGSGKTYLCQLLWQHLTELHVKAVVIHNFPRDLGGRSASKYLVEACQQQEVPVSENSILHQNIVFIIDDAQTTYDNPELWSLVHLANQAHINNIPRTYFCLFSTFGTPDRGVMPHNIGNGSLVFHENQRVLMSATFLKSSQENCTTLFYPQFEFEEVIERHLRGVQFQICDEVKYDIFNLTNGHPGLVKAMIYVCARIYHSYLKIQNVHMVDAYHLDVFVRQTNSIAACFLDNACFEGLPLIPNVLFPPEQEFKILCDAVRDGVPFDPQNQPLLRCLEQGWLHMEEDMDREYMDEEDIEKEDSKHKFKCYFPTTIHYIIMQYLIDVKNFKFPVPFTLDPVTFYSETEQLRLDSAMRYLSISGGCFALE